MVGLGDIWNTITDAWQWARTGWVAFMELLKKASGKAVPFITFLITTAKIGYDKVNVYISDFAVKMQALRSNGLDDSWTGIDYIAFINYVFPLEELVTCLVIVSEFWLFCLMFKMNWFFRRQIRLGK